MALEQLTGGEVDKRADLYALGVLVYECLTGRLPFAARSAPELAVLLATRVAVPPSRFASGLERDLEVAILRALERTPRDRFPDVSTFASALLGDANVARGRRLRRRAGLGVALLALVGGAGVWARAEQTVVRSAAADTALADAERPRLYAPPLASDSPGESGHGPLEAPPRPPAAQPLETAPARSRSAQRLDKPARPRRSQSALPASHGVDAPAASETLRDATEIRVEDF
jgi:hypothetical protein